MDWTHSYNTARTDKMEKHGQNMGYDKVDRVEEYREKEQDKGIAGPQDWLQEQKKLEFLTTKKIEESKK